MLERWVSQWLEFFRWFGGKKNPQDHAPRASSAALAGVHLPPRSRIESDASVFQRQKLEDFGEHDFAAFEALGREQAKYLLHHLEREAAEHAEEAQLKEARGFISNVVAVLCLGVMAVVGTLILRERPKHGGIEVVAISKPVLSSPKEPAFPVADFQRQVTDSQRRAVQAHPSLGVAGSHFNVAFTTRYKLMAKQQDARLSKPDWPEKLAEECARQLPSTYH